MFQTIGGHGEPDQQPPQNQGSAVQPIGGNQEKLRRGDPVRGAETWDSRKYTLENTLRMGSKLAAELLRTEIYI